MNVPQKMSIELAEAISGTTVSTTQMQSNISALAASIRRQVDELGIDPWTPALAQAIRESKAAYQAMLTALDQLEEAVNHGA